MAAAQRLRGTHTQSPRATDDGGKLGSLFFLLLSQ